MKTKTPVSVTARPGTLWSLLASLLLVATTGAWAGPSLIAMDWQHDGQNDVLVLTFDQAPAPAAEAAYDGQSLEARLTFWESRNLVPRVLREIAPPSRQVAEVKAQSLIFGESENTQVSIRFNQAMEYTVTAQGATVRVAFHAAPAAKGDSDVTARAVSPAHDTLAGIITFSPRLVQNDTMDLPPIDDTLSATSDSGANDLPTMQGFAGDDLPDMSSILGDAFEVPAQQSNAFLPPVGSGIARYADLLADQNALLDDSIWNTRLESLTFRDTPLQDALRLIAARSGLNILFNSRDVRGEITTQLRDVPLGAALEAILRVNGLAAVRQEGNIVRIVRREEVFSDKIELVIRARPLNWVRAEVMERVLKNFVSKEGEIVASRDANALVIKDSPANLAKVMELIDRLDVPEKQVQIEVMAVDFNVTMARQQGINWNLARPDRHALNLVVPGQTDPAGISDPALQSLFGPFLGRVSQGAENAALGRALPPPAGFGALSPLRVDQVGVRNPIAGTPNVAWEWGQDVSLFGQRFSLEASVQALESQNVLSVLAQPRVTTLNNIQAEIKIVRRTPFFETIQSPGSNNVSTTIKFEDVGLTVRAIPNITNNDFVRMQIDTEQKIFVDRQIDPATGATAITTDQRVFNSNVVVKDENTVVLGGLRSLDTTNNEQGTPWFRRAPVLGWLFKSIDRRQDKKELMLFVTPRIVKDPRLTEYQESRFGQLDMMWSLPDYFFDDTTIVPEDFYRMN